MNGKVIVWQMTEEQRLAYIEKHPIVPYQKPSGSTFQELKETRDWNWRGPKAARQRKLDKNSII
jgi:hypothetical protein